MHSSIDGTGNQVSVTSKPGDEARAVCVEVNTQPSLDLRRKHRRELTELILGRAVWLEPHDRVLIESVYRHGQTATQIAMLVDEDARKIRRRIRGLVKRVLSDDFVRTVRRLTRSFANEQREAGKASRRGSAWNEVRRKVAEECVINGRSLREAARALNLSLHTVRMHHAAVQAVLEADGNGRCP
ncbi:MAG TPA: hypothetical protein VK176_12300 [Phycisphaerales bacterium]|nr:hypothetical protein [Phycisphaerales bacterium]